MVDPVSASFKFVRSLPLSLSAGDDAHGGIVLVGACFFSSWRRLSPLLGKKLRKTLRVVKLVPPRSAHSPSQQRMPATEDLWVTWTQSSIGATAPPPAPCFSGGGGGGGVRNGYYKARDDDKRAPQGRAAAPARPSRRSPTANAQDRSDFFRLAQDLCFQASGVWSLWICGVGCSS
ncbi:hypothetical protein PAHAL_5G099200 [Panicum hallii]|uniref:Uncharacterized protein n=1 Tax=Panicum hallii TaxID=206008 RepID=A0A2T8IJL9_9POAL|nr:hypothetical protein PAHAL_5G099200 [Panicum hallii]